jgi:hypothetical protein
MVGSGELLHQVSELEREIDSLLEERYALALVLHSKSLRLNPLRRLYIWFTIRGLSQRLITLKLQRRTVYDGYLQLRRDEARRP